VHSIIITFSIKTSSRNAIRKKCGSNWCFYYFLFETKTVKLSVQCHVFAQSPPDRHPNDKYPVNTSHPPDLCKNFSLAVLFGSNGNSYTVCTQSDMCICVYILYKYTHTRTQIFSSQCRDSGRAREKKSGTAVKAACQGNVSTCHTRFARPALVFTSKGFFNVSLKNDKWSYWWLRVFTMWDELSL